ncbi:hypothetical protein WR25_14292 [Diploscapter pachys]|uniref:Degenerin mec-4/10 cytosolic domain-containing protein n=1 Tax=Diploscapter pachys TaxID=2018661 RepID=A0A2A2KGY5_9BILA|nr:hypothetical protein WR25_14292 [Diploscapter pachys]
MKKNYKKITNSDDSSSELIPKDGLRNRYFDSEDIQSMRGFRTDFSNYLASDTDFLQVTDIMTKFQYGEAMNDNHKEIQCNLLLEDGGLEIDPTRLTYHERILWHLKQFCYKTSSHGIPMLGQSPNNYYRFSWIIILTVCVSFFVVQAVAVVNKFMRKDKITDIQLKFDNAPFPAITLCNLNPYKDSMIRTDESVSKILSAFQNKMAEAGGKKQAVETFEDEYFEETTTVKPKRGSRRRKPRDASDAEHGAFEPAWSACDCDPDDTESCTGRIRDLPRDTSDSCVCAFDRVTDDAYPCFLTARWSNTTCQTCDERNYCKKKAPSGTRRKDIRKENCMCSANGFFCMKYDHAKKVEMLKLWEYFGFSSAMVDSNETIALGFSNMTDEVAIVTKAKENIIFAMGALSQDQRRAMSQAKHNLIHKCSFNGKPCDIDSDFQLISDPTFGNCFIFNWNKTEIKTSLRAGPMYGLRVMLFINTTDYLPTSEAVGVRLTIHDKEEFPFPDTFGYSAPTGYISSFGIRMQKLSRLPAPYGDCIPDGAETSHYIYKNYSYSTEGCYRTCFQELIIDRCNCSDPRFPSIGDIDPCRVFNIDERECLEKNTHEMGEIHGSFRCRCQQPCNQTVYTISYSEAIWPSKSLNNSLGIPCESEDEEKCNDEYQENAAMLEIFYEALNFEVLTESEAYGLVKMMADFGGQLGLWSGVSVMTICEFICLAFELLYMIFHHHYIRHKARQLAKAKENQF